MLHTLHNQNMCAEPHTLQREATGQLSSWLADGPLCWLCCWLACWLATHMASCAAFWPTVRPIASASHVWVAWWVCGWVAAGFTWPVEALYSTLGLERLERGHRIWTSVRAKPDVSGCLWPTFSISDKSVLPKRGFWKVLLNGCDNYAFVMISEKKELYLCYDVRKERHWQHVSVSQEQVQVGA